MSEHTEIDCRLRVAHEDFIMQNHVVHGVSVLPGVALIDIVYRVLLASGTDAAAVTLRDIRFAEPVCTRAGLDRELRVLVGTAVNGSPHPVRVDSRWSTGEQDWHENARAELIVGPPQPPAYLDLTRFGAPEPGDAMARFYQRTAGEGIRHGLAMRCSGEERRDRQRLLMRLRLDPSSARFDSSFHLHPAKMDASTLVAFGQQLDVGTEPFIPLHIASLRAMAPLGSQVQVYVPQPERQATSGDLVGNDYWITDDEGRVLVEIVGMSCKRIRHPELITRLVEPAAVIGPPAGSMPLAGPRLKTAPKPELRAYLRERIGARIGLPPDQVADSAGFYDLGLESGDLLRLGEELEEVTGASLYPTLLFEFGTIASLSDHLYSEYHITLPAASGTGPSLDPVRPPAAPQTPHADAWCARPRWQAAPAAPGGPPASLLVVGADAALIQALRERHPAVLGLGTGDIDRLAADPADGGTGYALIATGSSLPEHQPLSQQAAITLWRLGTALVRARPTATVPILVITSATPEGQALAALAATMSAEAPQLAIRCVEATDVDLAETVLTELGDSGCEPAVRYDRSGRSVRRWAPVRLVPDGSAPPPDGVYLIAGGAGGIAALLVDQLAARGRPRLVLLGRKAPDQALDRRIDQWLAAGVQVTYLVADIADLGQVEAACAQVRATFGRIDGVYHCAGEHRDGLFFRRDAADLTRTSAAKIAGTVNLDLATAADRLACFVLFSSLSAVLPNVGQADYAYGNAFQMAFAEQRSARADRWGRTLAIGWPLWADGGMRVAGAEIARARQRSGMTVLPTAAAMDILTAALAGEDAVLAVLYGDPGRIGAVLPAADTSAAGHRVVSPAAGPVGSGDADQHDAIAVIGIAGRYPAGADLEEFWTSLASGRSAITEVPAERWDHPSIFDADPGASGRTYGRWGGFLDGIERFDAAFFGISPKDAERMDPQERLFLTTAWHTFENAGYAPTEQAHLAVGVFVGVMWNHYQLYASEDGGVAPTAMHAAVANRVSYCLNLRGPSLAVDTACSSSLTAIHLAMQSLLTGDCELALAGGVNLAVHPQKYLQLAQGRFLSTDGRCHSFGADATGYVPGEGVGAVLLKPLSRAIANGDHIWAVLRASALNHTGRTSGFTVPSPAAQRSLVRAALDRAGWEPNSIGYVEAHGTGTSLGDPIEIEGLRQAFGTDRTTPCPIGSVKSNIGHAESAAGIAGLTKVLLQLRHGQLVPSLHADPLNPQIDFAAAGFQVHRKLTDWLPRPGYRRRAGISAFGAGGANAHLLVEQAPDRPARRSVPGPQLVVLSARDESGVRDAARALLDHLEQDRHPHPSSTGWPGTVRAAVAESAGIDGAEVQPDDSLADLGIDASGARRLAALLGLGPVSLDDSVGELAARASATVPAGTDAGSSEPIGLADLAMTLQLGRVPMTSRFAACVGDLDQLRERLAAFLGGEQPVGRWWTGRCDGSSEQPEPEPPADDLDAVGAFWARGGEVDWSARAEPTARRIPLPGYRFREEPFWIGRWRAARDVHPSTAETGSAHLPVTVTGLPAAGPPARELATPAGPMPAPAAPEEAAGTPVTLRRLDGGIALLSMQAGANMFDTVLLDGLRSAFTEIAGDDSVRAVVLTGTPEVFSMGATPDGLLRLAGGDSRFTDHPFMYEGLLRCDRPVITAMQGHASGGGLAFGLFADLVVLSRQGMYSANFVTLGFTPGMGASFVLEERLGAAIARELMFTGRSLSGAELAERGAAVRIVDASQVMPTALGLARSIAQKDPGPVRVLKRDLAGRSLQKLAEVIQRESDMHDAVFGPESAARIAEHFAKVAGFRAPAGSAGPGPADAGAADPGAAAPRDAAAVTLSAVPEATIAAAPAGAAIPTPAAVAGTIRAVLSSALYLEPSAIDGQSTFHELGLDSVGAVELVRDLNRAYGLDLESTSVYDHPTVDRLVAFVLDGLRRDRALLAAATAAEPAPAAAEPGAPREAGEHVPAPAPWTSAQSPFQTPAGTVVLSATVAQGRPRPVPTIPEPPAGQPGGEDRGSGEHLTDQDGAIAVIGMSGRFPDAADLAGYWRNLCASHDSVREVPAQRWDIAEFYDPDRQAAGRTSSKWAALLDRVDEFDPRFFRLSPLEAEAMDPQQRLFLQTAWSSVEDAGYAVDDGQSRRWGVFVGCAAGDYQELLRQAGQDETAHAFLGNSSSVLAARVAYLMNLTGPTMALDTACSSSLVAVHLACESIRAGDCDAALAGGVALMLTPRMHILTSKAGMLSPTGRCAPFDAGADGIVLGEGVGCVLLKRLDRAMADGDHVHGVILGSGVNGDGRTNGITAPSAASQSSLLSRVHESAGVSAADITYVEAHGTGTPLGDPIEVVALSEVLGNRQRSQTCAVGSVKGNIGHTTMSAGIAGLLKVLLSLRHRQLAPTLHFGSANPGIDFDSSGLVPVTAVRDWHAGPSGRLVGAVSSFGFSGTNAHVVLGEAPVPASSDHRDGAVLVPVSARTAAGLRQLTAALADALTDPRPGLGLADVAFTLTTARDHYPYRAVFLADGLEPLARALASFDGSATGAVVLTGIYQDEQVEQARQYLSGGALRWRSPAGRRCSLPGTPFATQRYWIRAPMTATQGVPAAADSPPPAGERFVLAADDWLVAEHRVGGEPILPAAAAIEYAFRAATGPDSGKQALRDVHLLRPIRPIAELRITLTGDRIEICQDGHACVRARVADAGVVPDRVELSRLMERLGSSVRSGPELMASFRAGGIDYGPSFEALRWVRTDGDQALALLRIPAVRRAELDHRPLHPAMLDAALQTVAVLVAASPDGPPAVPFAIRRVQVFGPVPVTGYAHASRTPDGYDVRLLDEDGSVRVRWEGLALRQLPAAAPEQPARAAGAAQPSVLVPQWRPAGPRAAV
ncbi:SDR family NAD(P)-dependent oxidoreductase, partial [Jatrophihabitans sp.]|uniref:SDR family NAD(P)-dependent oxidoreductase n=1 Tax=Jatrophihabitans sp. TaxID=1932789 RepID=UPI002EE01711